MEYQSFVAARVRAGDAAAREVHDDLFVRAQGNARAEEVRSTVTGTPLAHVRTLLEASRVAERERYSRAAAARASLEPVTAPTSLQETLQAQRSDIEKHVAKAAGYTEGERRDLERYDRGSQSRDRAERKAAHRAAQELSAMQARRHREMRAEAMRAFEERHVIDLMKDHADQDAAYRRYINNSLDLEAEMRDANAAVTRRLPDASLRLEALERAQVTRVGPLPAESGIAEIEKALEDASRSMPAADRAAMEREMRRERSIGRNRDSVPFGDR